MTNSDNKKALEAEVLADDDLNEDQDQQNASFDNDYLNDFLADESDESDESNDDVIETFTTEQAEKIQKSLPVVMPSRELITTDKSVVPQDPFKQYLKEISRYELLSPDEEQKLAKQLVETGDLEIAKKLVMANLRLVVKIAMEYRSAYQNVMDLIQEGNIGLMKAVSKYNPDKGAKLSYYASWWIKSYILKFILDNFRLIKIGTTAEQKKLFYNLMREKERLMNQGIEPSTKLLSDNLGVSEKAVEEMDQRLSSSGAAMSLDMQLGDDGRATLSDTIASDDAPLDESLSHLESLEILESNLGKFIEDLKPRDKEIFKKRLLSEVPPSLQSIADDYGVSRERIRQIEERLLKKLKVYMSDYLS
jgi:RNA polymerase sigma-32 factor